MDEQRFDQLIRLFSDRLSRRRMGLLGTGLMGLTAVAAEGLNAKKRKKKKTCQAGLTKCKVKKGKKKKTKCVDVQTDLRNCGGCKRVCSDGTPICEAGACVPCSDTTLCPTGLCCADDGSCHGCGG